jgi:hypothetical protein
LDINYLLEREQVERVRSQTAPSGAARDAHGGLADGYRQMLDDYRGGAVPGRAPVISGSPA